MKHKLFHTVTIRNKNKGRALTGASTELLLDGKKMKGVTSLVMKIDAHRVAKLKLEMVVDYDAEFEIGKIDKVIKKCKNSN